MFTTKCFTFEIIAFLDMVWSVDTQVTLTVDVERDDILEIITQAKISIIN